MVTSMHKRSCFWKPFRNQLVNFYILLISFNMGCLFQLRRVSSLVVLHGATPLCILISCPQIIRHKSVPGFVDFRSCCLALNHSLLEYQNVSICKMPQMTATCFGYVSSVTQIINHVWIMFPALWYLLEGLTVNPDLILPGLFALIITFY